MMERAEKISKPAASFSLNPKQMQKSRFAPRSFEPTESEHEAPASSGALHFSYNLLNIPIYPPVQRKEPEDDELQMKPSESCLECEEEAIQTKSIDNSITPIVQRQQNPGSEEEEEPLQGKMAETIQRQPDLDTEEEEIVQRKIPPFSYNLLNLPVYPPVQKQAETKPNLTGMPDQLKAGIESLSGIDMSDVRVHANSDKPALLNALAYTRGNEVQLGPGQEKHLAHEAWHVVQQKQGRVRPTRQMKEIEVNNDSELEKEAEEMGWLGAQLKPVSRSSFSLGTIQMFNIQNKPMDIGSNLKVERKAVVRGNAVVLKCEDNQSIVWIKNESAEEAKGAIAGKDVLNEYNILNAPFIRELDKSDYSKLLNATSDQIIKGQIADVEPGINGNISTVQETAPGKSLESFDLNERLSLFQNDNFLIQLGKIMAVDMLSGNADRFSSNTGKFGMPPIGSIDPYTKIPVTADISYTKAQKFAHPNLGNIMVEGQGSSIVVTPIDNKAVEQTEYEKKREQSGGAASIRADKNETVPSAAFYNEKEMKIELTRSIELTFYDRNVNTFTILPKILTNAVDKIWSGIVLIVGTPSNQSNIPAGISLELAKSIRGRMNAAFNLKGGP
jgi:hypothetical protein